MAERAEGAPVAANDGNGARRGVLRIVLDALSLTWLMVVLAAFGLLAFHPWPVTVAELRLPVPGIAELERLALPLLAGLLLAGIIGYFHESSGPSR